MNKSVTRKTRELNERPVNEINLKPVKLKSVIVFWTTPIV